MTSVYKPPTQPQKIWLQIHLLSLTKTLTIASSLTWDWHSSFPAFFICFVVVDDDDDVVVLSKQPSIQSLVRIGLETAETLLRFSMCGGGGRCKGIFLKNPTFVKLGWVELLLSWGCDNLKKRIKG